MSNTARVEERKKRRAQKKRRKVLKGVLMTVVIIVIAFASFLVTVKISKPDFDFKTLIPQKAIGLVEQIKEKTSNKPVQESWTFPKASEPEYMDYIAIEDFAFDSSKQGNQIGNIFNASQGKITYNASYIYFSKKESGIYRFTSSEETTAKLNINVKNCSSLNVVGDNLYFVNDDTSELQKCSVSGGKITTLAKDARKAYVYNDYVFYLGINNNFCVIKTDGSEQRQLFSAVASNKIDFVGVSLTRVFLTEHNSYNNEVQYITVSYKDDSSIEYFNTPSAIGEIVSMSLENGFFYYYRLQDNGSYNLCRMKYGSGNEVTLIKEVSSTDYPVVCGNRLYYSVKDGNQIRARELNMNTDKTKTILSVSDVNSSASVGVGFGYQYVFLIGEKSGGSQAVNKGTCIYTSSSSDNIMDFKDGKWRY